MRPDKRGSRASDVLSWVVGLTLAAAVLALVVAAFKS